MGLLPCALTVFNAVWLVGRVSATGRSLSSIPMSRHEIHVHMEEGGLESTGRASHIWGSSPGEARRSAELSEREARAASMMNAAFSAVESMPSAHAHGQTETLGNFLSMREAPSSLALPQEIGADVNKAPYPTVNIIEEGPRPLATVSGHVMDLSRVQTRFAQTPASGAFSQHVATASPQMSDIQDLAESASQLGDIYKRAVASQPSEQQKRMAVVRSSSEFLGQLADRMLAEERANDGSSACPECARDYLSKCPSGWRGDLVSNACVAPASYDGPCERLIFTEHGFGESRAEFESRCGVCWPCRGKQEA